MIYHVKITLVISGRLMLTGLLNHVYLGFHTNLLN